MARLITRSVLLFALAAPAALAMSWGGTWSTDHGDLRIVSIGAFVVGDYADRGTLVGQVSGSRLTGAFTNGGRAGRFEFDRDGEGRFSGTWWWIGETGSASWNGTQTDRREPALTNFARDGRVLRSQRNNRRDYNGTYESRFGTLRLRHSDLVLVGDYGDKGVLAGVWDGNGFVGTFTNGGRAGWFDFEFLSRTASFRSGRWGWADETSQGDWALRKTDSATPPIRNLHFYSSAASSARPDPAPPAEPHPATALRPVTDFTLSKLQTLLAMQHHVRFVSEPVEADGVAALREAGFSVHGGGFIDSEFDGPLASLFSTGRLRAAVATRGDDVVITFRGSGGSNLAQTLGNVGTDALGVRRRVSVVDGADGLSRTERRATAHAGFQQAYARLRPSILAAVDAQPRGKNVYVFGHSLGGALATLCALDLALHRGSELRSVTHVASGTPRVGGGRFRTLFERVVPNSLRVTVDGDPIPNLPRGIPTRVNRSGYYRHAGRLLPLTRDGRVQTASQIRLMPLSAGLADHEPEVYFQAVRTYATAAERNQNLMRVNVGALADAERERAIE